MEARETLGTSVILCTINVHKFHFMYDPRFGCVQKFQIAYKIQLRSEKIHSKSLKN